jgi:hypothetical protein
MAPADLEGDRRFGGEQRQHRVDDPGSQSAALSALGQKTTISSPQPLSVSWNNCLRVEDNGDEDGDEDSDGEDNGEDNGDDENGDGDSEDNGDENGEEGDGDNG